MLVSVSFQFIGFLLTYLLHTTHAARLGSRAGLGITLIQYGFALRSKLDDVGDGSGAASWDSMMSDHQSGAGHMRYSGMNTENATSPYATLSEQEVNAMMADATTEWLSFFLMTVGQFCIFVSSNNILTMPRLVYIINLRSRFLACKTLGERHTCLSARNESSIRPPTLR